jgi:diaminopimelate decarboxylase
MIIPGSPFFSNHTGQLTIEGQSLNDLALQFGTPLFVYSKASMLDALASYQRGFAGRDALICYAIKANSNLAVLQVFANAGCGFDIVSAGELARVLSAGADPKKIIFSGVGKSAKEMSIALQAGIGCFNIESTPELHALNAVAAHVGVSAPISIRVNPNVDAKTHPYISTGLKGNKFGVAHEEALATYKLAASLPHLRIVGIDCHIGSQITEIQPYLDAMDRILDLVDDIEHAGIGLEHIDFGGGLGIQYQDDVPPVAEDLWSQLLKRMDIRGHSRKKIVIEPGRSLVGNAGVCLTEVLYLKRGEEKNFCIVDAAMNDLPRPAMYDAFHQILPLTPRQEGTPVAWDVVGPICESGDWIGRDRRLTDLRPGDRLAVMSAGAYCVSMSSNYNTRPRAAEVLVAGMHHHLIRERETIESLIQLEKLLP